MAPRTLNKDPTTLEHIVGDPTRDTCVSMRRNHTGDANGGTDGVCGHWGHGAERPRQRSAHLGYGSPTEFAWGQDRGLPGNAQWVGPVGVLRASKECGTLFRFSSAKPHLRRRGPSGWWAGPWFCRQLSHSFPPGSLRTQFRGVFGLTGQILLGLMSRSHSDIQSCHTRVMARVSSHKSICKPKLRQLLQAQSYPTKISVISSGLSGRSETPREALKGW